MTLAPFEDALIRFVAEYKGNKLSIVATGGGVSLGLLASTPGASRVLHSFYCPYETQDSVQFLNRYYPMARRVGKGFADKAVSDESAEELFMALWTKNKVDGHLHIHNVAITAACTTTRYRKGDNQAFIYFKNQETLDDECWHLKVGKLSEEDYNLCTPEDLFGRRQYEDQLISINALRLAAGFEPEALEVAKKYGYLSRVL